MELEKVMVWDRVEFKQFVATVEERSDGMFISTIYNKDKCLEADRSVKVFETPSAAIADMYAVLFECSQIIIENLERIRDIGSVIGTGLDD